LAARTSLGVVALSLALLVAWTAGDLWGQSSARANAAFTQKKQRVEEEEEAPKTKPPAKKPRVKEEEEETPKTKTPPAKKPRAEEEEDAPKKQPKRKVIRVEEEEGPVVRPGGADPDAPAAGDLRQLAAQAKHPGVRSLFFELSVPHDHVVFRKPQGVTVSGRASQNEFDVEPIPVFLGTNPGNYKGKPLTLHSLVNGKRGGTVNGSLKNIEYVRCYEDFAQGKLSEFFNERYDQKPKENKEYLSHFDTLIVAEQALSAVLRWHESARQTGGRTGKEWEPIEAALRKRLLDDVLLKQMAVLVESGDWDKVVALARRLAVIYPDKADRERIARPVADLIQSALKDPTAGEKQKELARKRLVELEQEFPDNPVFKPLSDGLHKQAQALLDAARELGKEKRDPEKERQIAEYLRQAEEIWPQLPGLHSFKIERSLEHPVLRVGVRGQLPRYLSPALACTDAELRAVELLFESLVKMAPDESGAFRYRPGLAEHRPKVVPLGRQFQLPRNALWSNNQRLDAGDIRVTVQRLKAGMGVGRSRAWGELLDRVEVKGDPYQVTLRMHQGYLDPLALMTFKILPQGQAVDSEEFAKKPVCSGPFRLDPSRRSDEDNRECVFFVANPLYGSRPGKRELPRIQEIRFYSCADAVADLTSGKVDLVLDLTAAEADQLRQKASEIGVVVPTPSPQTPNRRIYFLAINQSKLPSAAVRKALAHAINREKLLDDHFRGSDKRQKIHKALNGPFPAGSWACNPNLTNRREKGSLDLFDADLARTLFPKQGGTIGPLKLKYPQGDPGLEKAMKDLCDQVKGTMGLVLEPTPCDPYQLREDVELTQSYDVAYYHYDFPDETYWLSPLLGPPPREGADSNMFKFTDIKIQPALKEAMGYRDFAKVRKLQWALHDSLFREMPFVPLWQLDSLLAYGSAVDPSGLDSVLVFTNIEQWRLRRK
jgi:ABC-type oligopeptide transport system substrate-binding subunit